LAPMKCWVHVRKPLAWPWDTFEREGGFVRKSSIIKPVFHVIGIHCAGTVEDGDPQVKRFLKGDRVYGISFLNPKGGILCAVWVVKETSLSAHPGKLHQVNKTLPWT